MGEDKSYPTVFDCQLDVCTELFWWGQKYPFLKPYSTTANGRPIYDITGSDAQQVVSVLSDIVNDRDQFTTNKTFNFLIHDTLLIATTQAVFEEFFRLKARPTEHQPGNAIVVLRPRGHQRFTQPAKSYEELIGALKAFYYDEYDQKGRLIRSGTTSFARHIQQLFENNREVHSLPEPTVEAYMILLFEIARRLVKVDNPSERKEEFDLLPIGSAIARILKLLALRRCTFEDVFLPGGTFHCFTGTPEQRKSAIHNINAAILAITKTDSLTTKPHMKELQDTFCSVTRPDEKFKYSTKPQLLALVVSIIIMIVVFLIALIFSSMRRKSFCSTLGSPS